MALCSLPGLRLRAVNPLQRRTSSKSERASSHQAIADTCCGILVLVDYNRPGVKANRLPGQQHVTALSFPTALRRWHQLGLWPKLALAVTLGFLLLFGVFSLLSLRAVNDSTDRILQERLVLAQMAAREIDRLVERGFYELEKATEFAPFDPQGPSLAEEYHLLAHAYGRVGALSLGVYFLDAEGKVVLSEPPGKLPQGADLSGEGHIRAVMRTGRRSVSEPFVDSTTNQPAVALTIPIFGPDGALLSMLSGLVDVTSAEVMGPLTHARDLGQTGHAELVDSRGLIIAATDYGGFLQPGEHLPFYLKAFREGGAGVENVPYTPWHATSDTGGQVRHVMAFAPVSAASWGVAVGGVDWETFAPVTRLRNTILLIGALSLAFLWTITLFGARLVVRPIRTLTEAAEQMASGNLDRPIASQGGGEIAVLGQSLETMRAQLKASMERVRLWGEELELKVAERTDELAKRNRQLAAVSVIATAASEIRDQEGMLNRCLEVVLEHTRMDTAAIRLVDPSGGRLVVAGACGDFSGFPCKGLAIDMGECPCGCVASDGAPVFLSADELQRVLPPCRAPRARAVAILPLKSAKGTLGVLSLSRGHGTPPGPEERETLNAICNQIAIAIDNTRLLGELGQVEAQRALDQMKAAFMSEMSHELRTPLGFIKLYATTLLRDDIAIDAATRQEFLTIIDEESGKLQRMIDDLLDASRLQTGRFQVDRKNVSLKEVLDATLHKAAPAIGQKGIAVKAQLSPDDAEVFADGGRIEQVLHNLLDNAARYSDPGTVIEVTAQVTGQQATVSVVDQGDGIPAQDRERVFEPFYRGENSRRRGARGTGLGLAVCKGIIESHGGRLWVESIPPQGSAFRFTLPLARSDTAKP